MKTVLFYYSQIKQSFFRLQFDYKKKTFFLSRFIISLLNRKYVFGPFTDSSQIAPSVFGIISKKKKHFKRYSRRFSKTLISNTIRTLATPFRQRIQKLSTIQPQNLLIFLLCFFIVFFKLYIYILFYF